MSIDNRPARSHVPGNRVDEVHPAGFYGERETIPTNILGERPVKRDPYIPQFIPNQGPDRDPNEPRGPFGVLHEDQLSDANLIIGENTMGHHIGMDKVPGAGQMDNAAKRDLGVGVYGIPAHISPEVRKRERFEELMRAHDQFAHNVEQNLAEIHALDPTRFDLYFPHLRKTHLPKSKPDMTHQGFTTFEALLASRQVFPLARQTLPPWHPDHPNYQPRTEEQKLLHWQQGGLVDMPRVHQERFGVTQADVDAATSEANRRLAVVYGDRPQPIERMQLLQSLSADYARATAPKPGSKQAGPSPQPWKETR